MNRTLFEFGIVSHCFRVMSPGRIVSPFFSSLAVFSGWIPQPALSQAGRILTRASLGRSSRTTETKIFARFIVKAERSIGDLPKWLSVLVPWCLTTSAGQDGRSPIAIRRRVSESTQDQALSAMLFLYRDVLGQELPWLENVVRAKRPHRLPVVLSHAEVSALLAELHGASWLIASLLYGSGLRLMECARLRAGLHQRATCHALRHTPTRGRLRHPYNPGASGA